MSYRLVPVSVTRARQFVQEHHRHNEAPPATNVQFAVGLAEGDEVIAVCTAGRPVARSLADGLTLEVNRVCVKDVRRNANSMMYGAIGRAAQALGCHRLVTYTLESESGASLRAAGFRTPVPIGARSWEKSSPKRTRYDYTIWGERRQAQGEAKLRWERELAV